MSTDLPYPDNYKNATVRFASLTSQLHWKLEEIAVSGQGPTGEELKVQIASSSGARRNTLIVSSGLHGVEGFFGSAIHFGLMQQILASELAVPDDLRIVLIHGLNPFGYAWGRRTDGNNIDLNRNFLLPEQEFTSSPELYPKMDSFLNPKTLPGLLEFFELRALYQVLQHGFGPVRASIAGGQHEFPNGLFFGGAEPSSTTTWLKEAIRTWSSESERVIHLDLHTGLGKFGRRMLIVENELSDSQRQDLDSLFGVDSYTEVRQSSKVYQATGSLGRWCQFHAKCDNYLFIVAEYGTLPSVQVLKALRYENAAFHLPALPESKKQAARRALKEAFCPRSTRWRRQVYNSALSTIATIIEAPSAF